MKNLLLLILLLGSATQAWAVSGDNFEYHGYMRTGVGSNLKGGDQNCYHQISVPGNEFRLGNECAIYGENLFRIYTPDAKKDSGEFYRANFGLAYSLDGKSGGDAPSFNVYGAYIEAGRLSGGNEVVWVGKRFYRDSDLHIDDFFYFADTSGSGAGVEQIPLANGNFAVALMFEDTTRRNTTGAPTRIETDNGRPRTILLDTRLFDLKFSEGNSLNLWAGLATSTGGIDSVNHVNYSDSSGYVLGVKYSHDIEQGYNRVAALHGRGLLQGMNLGGTYGTDPTQSMGQPYDQSAYRWRFVEDLMWQPSKKFATAFGAIYETWTLGSQGGNNGRWMSVGARPIYFFSDHYSIAFEAGVSSVRQANQSGSTPMTRFTIAPQISPKPEFYARPVLRAFITRTFVPTNGTALVSTGTAFGFQGEVWF